MKCPDVAECMCMPGKPCELNNALAERDAAQVKAAAALVALGLASEEVRELRAEVEGLTEAADDAEAFRLQALERAFSAEAEVARLTEALRQYGEHQDCDYNPAAPDSHPCTCAFIAALSPASTEDGWRGDAAVWFAPAPETEGR